MSRSELLDVRDPRHLLLWLDLDELNGSVRERHLKVGPVLPTSKCALVRDVLDDERLVPERSHRRRRVEPLRVLQLPARPVMDGLRTLLRVVDAALRLARQFP